MSESIDLDRLALRRVRAAYGHLDEVARVLALAEECLTLRAELRQIEVANLTLRNGVCVYVTPTLTLTYDPAQVAR